MQTSQGFKSEDLKQQAFAVRFLQPAVAGRKDVRKKLQSVALNNRSVLLLPLRGAVVAKPQVAQWSLLSKRVMDVVLAAFGLIAVSPLLAAIAAFIKVDSPGPVFYAAPRAGKHGQTFVCFKFRTMIHHADRLKEKLRTKNERQGAFFKMPVIRELRGLAESCADTAWMKYRSSGTSWLGT